MKGIKTFNNIRGCYLKFATLTEMMIEVMQFASSEPFEVAKDLKSVPEKAFTSRNHMVVRKSLLCHFEQFIKFKHVSKK